MKTTHKLDPFEGGVRIMLGAALLLIAWDYGWTVIGTGAIVLAVSSLATAFVGLSLVGKTPDRTPATPVRPSHLGHDVHDRAHEAHPIDTESL